MTDEHAVPWVPGEAGVETRKHAPATLRSRDPIAAVLAGLLPREGLVPELASGSGEHVLHFASCFPWLNWQPSDPDPHALASIEAWRQNSDFGDGRENVRAPLSIDAASPE